MTMPNMPPPGGWVVTGQTETTIVPPGQTGIVDGYQVSFVTGHGVHGSVFVPHMQYTRDVVSSMIAAKARELDAVAMLSGTTEG